MSALAEYSKLGNDTFLKFKPDYAGALRFETIHARIAMDSSMEPMRRKREEMRILRTCDGEAGPATSREVAYMKLTSSARLDVSYFENV